MFQDSNHNFLINLDKLKRRAKIAKDKQLKSGKKNGE